MGHDPAFVDGLEMTGAEAHLDLAPGEPCGHRIPALPDAHAGLAVDPQTQRQCRVEGLIGQGAQGRALGSEGPAHGLAPACDPASLVAPVGHREEFVELGHRGHSRHGHQMPSAEAAHLALDATLLVGPRLARSTAERVEAVVAAEHDEAIGLDAVTAPQDPLDRAAQVVVADPSGGSLRSARRRPRGPRGRPSGPEPGRPG